MQDAELLLAFTSTGSQAPFAELVSRHLGLVYGSALRQLRGDHHRAQEVTQMVFIALARKAARLADHPALPAWLHRTTQLAAADLLRREARRTAYEAAAARENEARGADGPADWSKVRPILDQSINGLGAADRSAILLRYFSALPYAEVGRRLRLSENAARMRVERALEKLRENLGRQGFASTSTVLAAWLTSEASAALPAAIAASTGSISGNAIAAAATATGTSALLSLMASTKFALATLTIAAVGASAVATQEIRESRRLDSEMATLRQRSDEGARAAREHAVLVAARDRVQQAQATIEALEAQLNATRAQTRSFNEQMGAAARARQSARNAATNSTPYDVSALDRQPRATLRPPPRYPLEMRAAGMSGQATIDFIVGADGSVHNAYVVSSTNVAFNQSALDAVNSWKFSAGQKSGVAVDTHLQVPITYTLNNLSPASPGGMTVEGPQDWFPPHS